MSLLLFTGFMVGCSDFEEINTDPNAASADQVQVEYFLNRSISGAQMNPHIAERVFVLYWNAAGRQEWNNTLPVGSYNDGWTNDYYSTGYLSGWLSGANTAIQIDDEQIANGTNKTYTMFFEKVFHYTLEPLNIFVIQFDAFFHCAEYIFNSMMKVISGFR